MGFPGIKVYAMWSTLPPEVEKEADARGSGGPEFAAAAIAAERVKRGSGVQVGALGPQNNPLCHQLESPNLVQTLHRDKAALFLTYLRHLSSLFLKASREVDAAVFLGSALHRPISATIKKFSSLRSDLNLLSCSLNLLLHALPSVTNENNCSPSSACWFS